MQAILMASLLEYPIGNGYVSVLLRSQKLTEYDEVRLCNSYI
jgi:hypothetical protein